MYIVKGFFRGIEDVQFNCYEMTLLMLYLITDNPRVQFEKYGIKFKVENFVGFKHYFYIYQDKMDFDKFYKFVDKIKEILLTDQEYVNVIFVMVQEYNKNKARLLKIDIEFDYSKIDKFEEVNKNKNNK